MVGKYTSLGLKAMSELCIELPELYLFADWSAVLHAKRCIVLCCLMA